MILIPLKLTFIFSATSVIVSFCSNAARAAANLVVLNPGVPLAVLQKQDRVEQRATAMKG